jgi:hypothetical protein
MEAMFSAEHLRTAEARVQEACGLLEGATGFQLEACLPLLEDARRLLAGVVDHGDAGRAAAGALAGSLARGCALAREAAAFYRECAWAGSPGARAYTPGGTAWPDQRAGRTLAEV